MKLFLKIIGIPIVFFTGPFIAGVIGNILNSEFLGNIVALLIYITYGLLTINTVLDFFKHNKFEETDDNFDNFFNENNNSSLMNEDDYIDEAYYHYGYTGFYRRDD